MSIIAKEELQRKITSRNRRKRKVLALLAKEGWRVEEETESEIVLSQGVFKAELRMACSRRAVIFEKGATSGRKIVFYSNESQLLGELADLHLTPIGVRDDS